MRPIIIGTAGHIDHGKTALIRALTGKETDRLEEEQRRGITIDLGFAWIDLKNGIRAGVIDVPGHEKFIRNMTAGAFGMDLVLLVIAADEGIMPQTREHIDILAELGIENGIIVLNKCDLADEEWLEFAEQEIREEVKGSYWETAPLVKVSAVTKKGIRQLQEQIEKSTEEISRGFSKRTDERTAAQEEQFRLFVDRTFLKEGFGTVVTGTVLNGSIRKEEEVEVYPTGQICRVRNLQAYGNEVNECRCGERAACNLSGIKKEALRRGCVLAEPGSLQVSRMFSVRLHILPGAERLLENRCRLHLYCGTTEVLCRAVLLDREVLAPGEYAYAQLLLEEEAAFVKGDRFVVRFYSPLETIGGGEILHVDEKKRKRFRKDTLEEMEIWENGSLIRQMEMTLATENAVFLTKRLLAKLFRMHEAQVEVVLKNALDSGTVLRFGSVFCCRKRERWFQEKIRTCAEKNRREHPFRRGIGLSEVRNLFFTELKDTMLSEGERKQAWSVYLTYLQEETNCRVEFGSFALSDFDGKENAAFVKCRELLELSLEKSGFQFSKNPIEILQKNLEEEKKNGVTDWDTEEARDDFLKYLEEEGQIVKLCDEVYARKCEMDEAVFWIEKRMSEEGKVTVAEVRDHFACGRKHAKLIFDYTDRINVTRKDGAESERVPVK